MIIPEADKRINYRYVSSLISMNIILRVSEVKYGCKNVTIEGPFIGKYFAIIFEDALKISLLAYGKGLYYGNITREDINKPLFDINKSDNFNRDIPIGENYILNRKSQGETIEIGHRKYEDCTVLTLTYEKGRYTIYLKEGIGLILIRNMVNNIIKDEIYIQEA